MKQKTLWAIAAIVLAAGIIFVLPRLKEARAAGGRDKWIEAATASKICGAVKAEEPYPGSYQGALIDAHMHVPSIPDEPFGAFGGQGERLVMGANVTMADYVCLMESENIKRMFSFFPVWEPIVEESLLLVN